jgi:hypothetical protein
MEERTKKIQGKKTEDYYRISDGRSVLQEFARFSFTIFCRSPLDYDITGPEFLL